MQQTEGVGSEGILSRFWLRRLCEASLFVSAAVLAMYAWARFVPIGTHFPTGESISDIAAAVSAGVTLVSLILCFWLPRRFLSALAIFAYGMILLTVSVVISTSGGASSLFVSSWLIVSVFAAIFGFWMVLAVGGLLVGMLAWAFYSGDTTVSELITSLIFGVAPLILSMILWHRQPRKKAKDAYAELANKLSSTEGKSDVVISTINDGVLAISSKGIIELINPAAQQMIGWTSGDALGLNWQSVLKLATNDGKDAPDSENPIVQALRTNKPTHTDKLFLKTTSDKRRPITIVSSPVSDQNEGIIVVFRDISKEMAEEREQAEFISTASHEMRTPVASIEGYLGLALNPATAQIDEKARDFITKAHESAQHLGRLFQDLLDVSRAEDGRLKNEPEVVNVNDFTANVFQSLAPKAAEKGLNYTFKPIDSASDQVIQPIYLSFVDPDHLREVLSNLIENAIKYTLQGDVVVDLEGDDDVVRVSVADSGIGIPAEDLPHLFQKFYRVDNSDTREIGGTGLGLYLSRRLAESMSGQIKVDSKYGEGSTFYLEIPRISREEADKKMSLVKSVETPQPAEVSQSIQPPQTAPAPQSAEAGQSTQATPPAQPTPPLETPAQINTPNTTETPATDNSAATERQTIAVPERQN